MVGCVVVEELLSDIFIRCPEYTFLASNVSPEDWSLGAYQLIKGIQSRGHQNAMRKTSSEVG